MRRVIYLYVLEWSGRENMIGREASFQDEPGRVICMEWFYMFTLLCYHSRAYTLQA
jgi:hypothetical protein